MICPNCGERLLGDGYSTPLICPSAIDEAMFECLEPDAPPFFCPVIHVSEWTKATTLEVECGGLLIAKGN